MPTRNSVCVENIEVPVSELIVLKTQHRDSPVDRMLCQVSDPEVALL